MHYLKEDAPRKEKDLNPQVENKGTTRSNVDPKLRKRRDLKKILL
jgi:hypothetical protein